MNTNNFSLEVLTDNMDDPTAENYFGIVEEESKSGGIFRYFALPVRKHWTRRDGSKVTKKLHGRVEFFKIKGLSREEWLALEAGVKAFIKKINYKFDPMLGEQMKADGKLSEDFMCFFDRIAWRKRQEANLFNELKEKGFNAFTNEEGGLEVEKDEAPDVATNNMVEAMEQMMVSDE